MADKLQVEMLLNSVAEWNDWRARNPKIRPDLSEARLAGADLSHATLNESDLIAADLRRTVLARASLVGALMLGADLRGADLSVADLRGADLRGANLSRADLSKSFFLIQTQVESAIGDRQTRLPPSVTRPDHWGEPSKMRK
jgi:uncharacterized protein YjbI with pentapeptide repeats